MREFPMSSEVAQLKFIDLSSLDDNQSLSVSPSFTFGPNEDFKCIVGDARYALSYFDDNIFQCCITSPPYWGLRDYNIEGQIGAEDSLDEYISDLVSI